MSKLITMVDQAEAGIETMLGTRELTSLEEHAIYHFVKDGNKTEEQFAKFLLTLNVDKQKNFDDLFAKGRMAAPKAPKGQAHGEHHEGTAKPAKPGHAPTASKPHSFEESQHPRGPHGQFISGGGSHKLANAEGVSKPFHELPPLIQDRIVRKAIATNGPRGTSPRELMMHVSQATGSRPDQHTAAAVSKSLTRQTKSGEIQGHKEIRELTGKHRFVADSTHIDLPHHPGSLQMGEHGAHVTTTVQATQEVYTFKNTAKGLAKMSPADKKGYNFQHNGDISRPDKFHIDSATPHGQFLESRRGTYGNTKFGVMGRVFSNEHNAPEMTHANTRADLRAMTPEQRKIAIKNIGNKTAREDAFKGKDFYDGQSSVNGLVGVMTKHTEMLKNSKLQGHIGDDGIRGHSAVLTSVGLKATQGNKPYYANTLTNHVTGKSMEPKDFEGLKNPEMLKKATKAIFTPGTYGSKASVHGDNQFRMDSPGHNAMKRLMEGGMSEPMARNAAAQMVHNFNASPLFQFNAKFRDIVAVAPQGFVYTNPMSGFKMTFDKFNTASHSGSMSVIDATGKTNIERVRIPHMAHDSHGHLARSTPRTRSGASALFVQNWDSAVMGSISRQTGSVHTLHDAIAIPKGPEALNGLHTAVTHAYTQVAHHDPVHDLANQIRAAVAHDPVATAKLNTAVHNFDNTFNPGSVPKVNIEGQTGTDGGHFVQEHSF